MGWATAFAQNDPEAASQQWRRIADQRARYMTLESIAQTGDDAAVSLTNITG